MKKALRNIVVVGIAILFGWILGVQNRNVSHSELSTSTNSRIEISPSVISSALFGYSEQSESQINTCNHIARPGIKHSFNQFTDCPLAYGKLLFTKYLPYLFYPEKNVNLFKSTDIIFPFHHFW